MNLNFTGMFTILLIKRLHVNHLTAAFYNRIAILYPVINLFLKKHKKRMIAAVNDQRPGRLLEIGVGDGSHLQLYKFHRVIGIDISETMLKRARRGLTNNTTLLRMNGENILFPQEYFDYIVLSHILAVTTNPGQLIEEAFRVLKPGGKLFILNHFTPSNWLRYFDRAVKPLSVFFHFKSCFYLEDIPELHRFHLVEQVEMGLGSYFKLMIFEKH